MAIEKPKIKINRFWVSRFEDHLNPHFFFFFFFLFDFIKKEDFQLSSPKRNKIEIQSRFVFINFISRSLFSLKFIWDERDFPKMRNRAEKSEIVIHEKNENFWKFKVLTNLLIFVFLLFRFSCKEGFTGKRCFDKTTNITPSTYPNQPECEKYLGTFYC